MLKFAILAFTPADDHQMQTIKTDMERLTVVCLDKKVEVSGNHLGISARLMTALWEDEKVYLSMSAKTFETVCEFLKLEHDCENSPRNHYKHSPVAPWKATFLAANSDCVDSLKLAAKELKIVALAELFD